MEDFVFKHGCKPGDLEPHHVIARSLPTGLMIVLGTLAPKHSRVGKGISAQASHRTVREALTSYGSYHIIKHV